MKVSIKYKPWGHISRRGWVWIGILYVCAVLFYKEFFGWPTSLSLALFITTIIVLMLLVGYQILGAEAEFPLGKFIFYLLIFSSVRIGYIYLVLSKYLPEYTIFHYPERAIPATVFGTAALLFLGYSYAIYEWGHAAREKYLKRADDIIMATGAKPAKLTPPLSLRCNGKTVYVLPDDIVYINANREYIDYHTLDKRYTCFQRLKEVEGELKKHGFLRTHRSYIVNLQHVKSSSPTEIITKDGVEIPLSKTYRQVVLGAIEG